MIFKVKRLLKEKFMKNYDLFDDNRKGNLGNKLRTYRQFKNTFQMEPYLLEVKSLNLRKKLTQLRVGSHHLHIETGRHSIPYKDPSDRICSHCNLQEIEDEKHFVMTCPLYAVLRENLFNLIVSRYSIFHIYCIV